MSRWGAALLAALGSGCVGGRGDDRLTLELAHRTTDAEPRIEARVLGRFERAHPGLRVVQQSAGTGAAEYRARILTAIAAGAPPDAFMLDPSDVPHFADHGLLLDLAPYLSRLGVRLDRYHPAALDIFRRGAAVYAVPTGYLPVVVSYNKDLFDRAGIPYPPEQDWTWDGFRETARRLTRDTDGDGRADQWGAYLDLRAANWIPWVWSGGGDVLCPDGRRARGCLDAPATVAALRWYRDWATRDSIAPRAHRPRRPRGDDWRLFSAGRVAMLTGWPARSERLRVGFAVLPHRPGAAPTTAIHASGYAVPARPVHRQPSVALATFLADSVVQAVRAPERLAPSLVGIGEARAAGDTLGGQRVFLRAAAAARTPWAARIERWGEIETVLQEMMDRITVSGVDPAIATRETAARLDRLLAGERSGP